MKIIERAERYACDELSECRDDVRDAYIQGATDQLNIDVDKACEWLRTSEIANFSESQIKYFKEAMMDE